MAVLVKMALVLSAFQTVSADQASTNQLSDPLGKVNELLSNLKAKIIKEGEEEAKAYEDWVRWCGTASRNINYEIKNYDKIKEKQEAKVKELASDIEVATSKIEEVSGSIATSQGELDQATAVRAKENADFVANEKELVDTVDALGRAISIISAEMAKNPSALMQIDQASMASLLQGLSVVVDAAGVSSSDRNKLLAFVQARQGDEDELGAPAGATYKSQSGNIVNVLGDLKEKAEDELAEARKAEKNSKHNFQLMKQSLEDEMAADTKELNVQKSAKAEAEEEKSKTEGDLANTLPNLEDNKKSLQTFSSDCMQSAVDHESTVASRDEEIKVITEAIKILHEEASGAGEISRAIFQKYSFLQTTSMTKSTMRTQADLAGKEVASMIKTLSRQQHSAALAQLASRISVVVKYGGHSSADPFQKIKGLISEMIAKLTKEAESEATEKAYCDEQMAKTESKRDELQHDHAKLTTKIDKAVARSSEFKEDIKSLHEEVALLADSLAELHQIRSEEHANYVKAKTDLEDGLAGVRRVADILIKYYGNSDSAAFVQDASNAKGFLEQPAKPQHHEKAGSAGGPIIDILEVVESDFAATLTKEETQEADAKAEFDQISTEKRDSKIAKDRELQYKKEQLIGLEKDISELTNDRETLDSELSAVLEYYAQVKQRCVAKPHSYEDRVARRQAEINGLKDALSTLESEAALLQRKRRMRGGTNVIQ